MKLSEYFGSGTETVLGRVWDWSKFKSTKNFPVSENLLDWVIGQEQAMKECYLCLDEWVHKLNWMHEEEWFKLWDDPNKEKPNFKKLIPPGPYLMLLGDPGTGKSLIGRALSRYLTKLYKSHNIKLQDVLCWPNKIIPSNPKISCHPSGKGKQKVKIEHLKVAKKSRIKRFFVKFLSGFMTTVASIFIGIGLYWIYQAYEVWVLYEGYVGMYGAYVPLMDYLMQTFVQVGSVTFLPAGMMLIFLILIIFMGRMGFMGGAKGISGSEQSDAPKLIIDNSQNIAPFIDATGHKSPQLFGSIAWDPLQTGGLGTQEHQRTTAGDVHKANLGILYIDEIKNLFPAEAVTLLTVLEEGQLPITLRSKWDSGGTSAMAVSTEPIPSLCFLVGAGNFDSIKELHPALMDRILGYGKVVRMSNEMDNSLENRRRYVQFIAQEGKRFHLPPFSVEACAELVREGRRRSNRCDRLTTKFRPLISIIKTAGTIAVNDKSTVVTDVHVKEAIDEHCKSIQQQLLEHHLDLNKDFMEISPKGIAKGKIYGLVIQSYSTASDKAGSILPVIGQLTKLDSSTKRKGFFNVTGVKDKDSQWVQDSIKKVRSVILNKYGIDVAQDYHTHIDFSQYNKVDGPSAGVTMSILLCSLIENKSIRQDVAVTGEINISSTNEIIITPIGGVHEKIKAAESWGFKKVVIPYKNFKYSIDPSEYSIEVVGAKTLDDYLKHLLSTD